jgi:hypothetical protein
VELRLNASPQFVTEIDGFSIELVDVPIIAIAWRVNETPAPVPLA